MLDIPNDPVLQKALIDAVRKVFKSGDPETLTPKQVRSAVETNLGIKPGFFKNDTRWKDKSKEIIASEFARQETLQDEASKTPLLDNSAAKATTLSNNKKRVREKQSIKPKDETSRLSSLGGTTQAEVSNDLPAKQTAKVQHAAIALKDDAEVDRRTVDSNSRKTVQKATKPIGEKTSSRASPENSRSLERNNATDLSDSEMSVVLDESPPRKRRQKSASAQPSKKVPNPKVKSTRAKEDNSLDPQDAEIKRLQSWLLKCGVRKLWHRELASYTTPKAKINHLRDLLKDIGMEGRFSAEKARQIKEERELKEDLEAVQAGAKQWGHSSDEGIESGGKPKRKLARGLKDLAMFDDDESD